MNSFRNRDFLNHVCGIQLIYPCLIFLVFFQLYLMTMCPTVYWEDSSEFITAAHSLGITHPTGYPTYCIIGKCTGYLFLGDIPYRVNLVSALSAALGITLFSLVMVHFFRRLQPGTSRPAFNAGILFAVFYAGFLSPWWSEGVVAEVYALNIFFTVVLLLIQRILSEKKSLRLIFLFPFVYGLALSNHMTLGLYLPVFSIFFLATLLKKRIEWRNLAFICMFGIIGLTPYFYTVCRAGSGSNEKLVFP